jgi:hypothetical protein
LPADQQYESPTGRGGGTTTGCFYSLGVKSAAASHFRRRNPPGIPLCRNGLLRRTGSELSDPNPTANSAGYPERKQYLSMQNARGRRRASGPAPEPRLAEAIAADRPRDAQREARRRRRGPFRQVTDFASASGVGQKAGVALAATGLLLTVTVPATSPVLAAGEQQGGARPLPRRPSRRSRLKQRQRSTSAARPSPPPVTRTESSSNS